MRLLALWKPLSVWGTYHLQSVITCAFSRLVKASIKPEGFVNQLPCNLYIYLKKMSGYLLSVYMKELSFPFLYSTEYGHYVVLYKSPNTFVFCSCAKSCLLYLHLCRQIREIFPTQLHFTVVLLRMQVLYINKNYVKGKEIVTPTWLLFVDIAGVDRLQKKYKMELSARLPVSPLAGPANTSVSLPLQLMKATVLAGSSILYSFSSSSVHSSDVYEQQPGRCRSISFRLT